MAAASASAASRDPGIRVLAGLLRAAGLDPSAEELADALWLAARTREAARGGTPDVQREGARAGDRRAGSGSQEAVPEEGAGPPVRRGDGPEPEDPVTLYPDGAGQRPGPGPDPGIPVSGGGPAAAGPAGAAGMPVRVPGAAALPRILDIQRALRALQRHRPPGPPTRHVLDEAATAEASARALGLVIPVFRPETRREATVRLVMDASPSMAVWQEMFEELRAVCERLGAFRDVQVHYLHRLADGMPAVGRGPAPGGAPCTGDGSGSRDSARGGLRSADQLRDPTGRTLTMLVSDCAGPVWREGEAQRLLHRWAQCTPCVVVQPLPQRLWNRSWLPTERGVLERATGGTGDPGAGPKLRFRADRAPRPGRPAGGLTVPVLPPSATALGAWARLVAGLGTGPVPAEVGRVLARHPASPLPPPRAARPPHELVRRFRSTAAPGAVQLAVYLSAAPLTLPVMRLVQRTMLPDSEPSDLAEVLLSGLLRRSGEAPGLWYEFVPGVQDVLLGPLGRDEAALVLKHCSEYVLAHFGRGVRNFPALAVSQLTGVPAADPATEPGRVPPAGPPQAFAHVSAKVVRRYLPGPPEEPAPPTAPPAPPAPGRTRSVRAARARLADADARALHEAAALLRRAVAAPPGPGDPPEEAETELAAVLLRLWAEQRDPDLLDEAERALTGLRTAAAWAVLGRVLYERALAGGPDAELLAAADREFAAAGAAAGPDTELRRDCAVRRARTLIRLGELREDAGPLREARAALEALLEPGPTPTHPELLLALGRVLLALLPRTPDPAERTALAEQAAAHLTPGLAAQPDGTPGRAARARVRVELAEALRHLPGRLEEAAGQLARALEEAVREPELRLAALLCLARVHRARHARDADPAALEQAAEAYGRARALIPRDADAFAELLPEWGDVLLDRARAADGRRFASLAVRVLRESRAAVPQSDPGSAYRLLRLATGLRLRHAYEGDLVDLREAEYLLELAARQAHGPLDRARAWREHGDVQQEIHAHTRTADRLDRAADSYRRAWRAALEADRAAPRTDTAALHLAARAQELRGEVLERLARPRAALDAYRAALELWQGLGAPAGERARAVQARIHALEAAT
ncbi:SAV_2336 N-terminal domain-related protein [Streptomyces sp. NBC_00249]|uniref:SAV_2336 N-terminal domain-related protein n=1 Tax=Streptomyces sp. NBC_00249 TaxID=2975690 RepID=UPI00225870C0|nr:SAV_2336 N-terminal domain-related protein [Streptomyces sp. NBC_00249]MCX5194431.1 SAV_2336 N-terminal domain-related protein [Streptomyces sp. NBC_00249]